MGHLSLSSPAPAELATLHGRDPRSLVGLAVSKARCRRRRFAWALALSLGLLMAVPTLRPSVAEARRGGGFSRSFGHRSRSHSFRSSRHLFRSSRTARRRPSRRFWGSASGGYQRKGGLTGRRPSARGSAFARGKRPSTMGRRMKRNSRGQRMLPRSSAKVSRVARASAFRQRYHQPSWHMRPRFYGSRPWGGWGYGSYSVGMWDMFFLSTASHMFWYHHWRDPQIHKALYEDQIMEKKELARLETRVKELEAKGVARDPNYLPEDVDPDLAYSKDYVEKNQTEFYAKGLAEAQTSEAQEQGDGSIGWLVILFALFGVAIMGYTVFIRRY